MGRNNGTFKYKPLPTEQRNPETGYISASGSPAFVDGGECQIDRGFPAIRKVGADGGIYGYNHDVFIQKSFMVELAIGMEVELTMENGETETFTIQGIDSLNRRYTEIWG